jgi:hypothetical protein
MPGANLFHSLWERFGDISVEYSHVFRSGGSLITVENGGLLALGSHVPFYFYRCWTFTRFWSCIIKSCILKAFYFNLLPIPFHQQWKGTYPFPAFVGTHMGYIISIVASPVIIYWQWHCKKMLLKPTKLTCKVFELTTRKFFLQLHYTPFHWWWWSSYLRILPA